jgi:hypothetical protein
MTGMCWVVTWQGQGRMVGICMTMEMTTTMTTGSSPRIEGCMTLAIPEPAPGRCGGVHQTVRGAAAYEAEEVGQRARQGMKDRIDGLWCRSVVTDVL